MKKYIYASSLVLIAMIAVNTIKTYEKDFICDSLISQNIEALSIGEFPGDSEKYINCKTGEPSPTSGIAITSFWCGNCKVTRFIPSADGTCRTF